jgi:hypothetical protein
MMDDCSVAKNQRGFTDTGRLSDFWWSLRIVRYKAKLKQLSENMSKNDL